jgi:hypothetical protein
MILWWDKRATLHAAATALPVAVVYETLLIHRSSYVATWELMGPIKRHKSWVRCGPV